MKFVSAFNGKTLHDSTNRWSVSKVPMTRIAEIERVKMANGTLFDPNYGTGSVATPEPFPATFFMRFSTKAAAETELDALDALTGTNGTITASLDSGGTAQTCNASLNSINLVTKKSDFAFLVTLNFEPFDDWS